MKLLRYISLRYIIFQILFLATVSTALAQEISYSPADGSQEYWYIIRFRHNMDRILTHYVDGNGVRKLVTGTYSRNSDAANAEDELKWKLVETNKDGEYFMVSKSGKYVSFSSSRFVLVDSESEAKKVRLIPAGYAAYAGAWEIQRVDGNSNQSMNPNGGVNVAGHELGEWNVGTDVNAVQFDIAETYDANAEMYLQFSAHGRRALYDDGTSASPIAKIPDNDETQPDNVEFKWRKQKKDGGYVLLSGHDRFLAVNAAGDGLEYVDTKDDATVFNTPLNPYTCDVNGTGGHTVIRYQYTTTVNGIDKAISVDLNDGSIDLIDVTATGSRASVIRETQNIDGAEWPANVDGDGNTLWYSIVFPYPETERLITAEDKHAYVNYGGAAFPAEGKMLWTWEDAGDDNFYLKNKNGEYLTRNGSGFSAASTSAGAAKFRFAEYAETGVDRNKWVLQWVDATDANQYLRPSDNRNSLTLTNATADLSWAVVSFSQFTNTPAILTLGYEHTPQQIFYSTNDHEYWYVIRFYGDGAKGDAGTNEDKRNYAIRCESDRLRSRLYPEVNSGSNAPDNMKWKFIPSDEDGWYYMVSKVGWYVKFQGSDFVPTTNPSEAAKVHLIYDLRNRYKYAWQIQRKENPECAMNPIGGVVNKAIGEYNMDDQGNAMLFELVEEIDKGNDIFLQFSGYGRQALYDDGTNLVSSQPVENIPTDLGYMWTKTKMADGSFILCSGKGNYIALSGDGNSLVLTTDKTKAANINVALNSYTGNVAAVAARPVERYVYTIGSKNISIDMENGSIKLIDASSATRATIIRETVKIDGDELPVESDAANTMWYDINFTRTDDNLITGTDGDKYAFVGQGTSSLDRSRLWSLAQSESDDLILLRNHRGQYLYLNDTRFAATEQKTSASTFRLIEYAETGDDRDKWVLQYVGTGYNYMMPSTDKSQVNLTTPGTLVNSPIIFKKKQSEDVDFCTEEDDYWRKLVFFDEELEFNIGLCAGDNTVSAGTPDATHRYLWKNIGDKDGFVLKNTAGQYLALNAAGDGFVYTIDKEKATTFSLSATTVGGNLCATKHIVCEVNGTKKVLRKNAEGNIVLMNEDEAGEAQDDVNLFFDQKVIFRTFSFKAGEYYTIGIGNDYLTDGFGDVYDAVTATIGSTPDGIKGLANDYLWTFVQQGGTYVLQNRNGNYLTCQGDGTFSISTKESLATLFHVGSVGSVGENAKPLLMPVGGEKLTDEQKGKTFLAFDANKNAVISTAQTSLTIEQCPIYVPEDYTQYGIIHKRSWFIKLADMGQEETSNSFIHVTEDGSYGMKEFTLENGDKVRRQNTNDYRIVRYMKRNTMREFKLPTSKYGGYATPSRVTTYQRWYNYNTDGLIPDSLIFLNQPYCRNYRNGTVMGDRMRFNGNNGSKVGYGFHFKMPDNVAEDFEYTVGIDMSFYTDFVEYFGDNGTTPWPPTSIDGSLDIPVDNNLVEPTLAQRCIYVVRNAHIMAKQLTALSTEQDKWLEEYNVAFPARKVNFKDCALPLDNEFANYWIYKDGVPAEENLIQLTSYNNLEFVIKNNTANISLSDGPIVEGATGYAGPNSDLSALRFFRFKYPTVDGKEHVEDGKTADIEVYAKDGDRRYRLAVYHLTFVDGTELRPYTEIIGMKDDGTGNLVPKSARSPRQLRRDIGEPKASITFDFQKTYQTFLAPPKGKNYATKGERDAGIELPNTYRFPLRYENTSYAFEPTFITNNGDGFNYTDNVEENGFGAYTIARTTKFAWNNQARFYPVRKYYHEAYPDEDQYNYDKSGFLYIDVSECPGRMASLAFDGNICKGTRITVSAWVSSPNSPNRVQTDVTAYANVFFNILGYYKDKNGEEQEDKIYTYCPGPISGDALSVTSDTIVKSESGQEGVWQQIYFTFIPRTEHIIERFVLNVNNGCTSSAGGDIVIDDIEVYSATPSVNVTNTLPVCNSRLTLTKIESDYESMMNSLGLEDEDLNTYHPSINFCVVDSILYHHKLDSLTAIGDNAPANNAMRLAAVGNIHRVTINSTFDKLPLYEHAKAAETTRPTLWKLIEGDMKKIIISDNIVSDKLLPNKKYYIASYFTYSNETVDFSTFQVGTKCSISSVFTTRNSFHFIIDGDENLDMGGEATVCAGSNVTLSAKFRGIDKTTGEELLEILPCDWWLDYYGGDYDKAYINPDGSYDLDGKKQEGAVSLNEALRNFRFFYPNAISTEFCHSASGQGYTLTDAMIEGLTKLSKPVSGEDARPALLMLYRRNINLHIPTDLIGEDGSTKDYKVTIQPISNLTDIDEKFENAIICFDANSLTLRVNGKAPGLLDGFGSVDYPEYMHNVPLRLTLKEFKDVWNTDEKSLKLPLHSVETVMAEATGLESIEIKETDGTSYKPLYIADTTDPDCDVFTADGSLREVGRILEMSAEKTENVHYEGYVLVRFLDSFLPREGYTYTMRLDYREILPEGTERTSCNGSCVFDLKIVPKYAVWTAAAGNSEWTNDLNWRRADRTDLKFEASTEAEYLTNEQNTTAAAFVPLAGTSVIIAPDALHQPVLFNSNNQVRPEDKVLLFTGHTDEVTQDIAYDMILKTDVEATEPYSCQLYRTNTCDGMVLQAGAEMVQAQHLEYNRAWVEYELDRGRWYTLASPLQRIYAGDWYAPTTDGRESAPYFYDINYKEGHNNRFRPAVYQRGWDKGETKLYFLDDDDNLVSANVALLAEWSSVYNDVDVPYESAGFSLKAESPAAGKLLFRLPKEDTSYKYYKQSDTEGNGGYEQNETVIIREDSYHKLWTDNLKTASDPKTVTVSLQNEKPGNKYYLVSNPFPCGLDVNKFFKENEDVLEQKFWLLTAKGQSSAIKDENSSSWITVNNEGITKVPVLSSGQGFFVKVKGNNCELKYSAEMMAQSTADNRPALQARTTRGAASAAGARLHIRAERNGYASEAVILKDDKSRDAYSPEEDMETLVDDCLASTPTVYTLAGTHAATVNRRSSVCRVGLGVTGHSDEQVKLTFSGMDAFDEELSLMDVLTGETTPITTGADSISVYVSGQTTGRYFIVSSADGKYITDGDDGTVSITSSRGDVTITATGRLLLEEVYAIAPDGRVLYSATPNSAVHKFHMEPGIYLFSARTAMGTVTRKFIVE